MVNLDMLLFNWDKFYKNHRAMAYKKSLKKV